MAEVFLGSRGCFLKADNFTLDANARSIFTSLADVFFLSNQLGRVLFVFTDNKEGIAFIDSTCKVNGAEITIGYPDLILHNGLQHGLQ